MIKTDLTTAISVVLVQAYIFWRIATVPAVKRYISRRWLIIVALALWVLFYAGFFGIYTLEWIITLVMIFLVVLAADIVSGFGFFLPRIAGQLRGIALAVGLVISVAALVQGMRPPALHEHEVYLNGLPTELDGTVLAAISDIHADPLTKTSWLEARVEQLLEMRPDMIVLLGDILDSHGSNYDDLVQVLKTLNAPLGVWAVLGNHEYHGGFERNIEAFGKAGIRLLRNDWVEIRPEFVLAGVDYVGGRDQERQDEENFHLALDDRPAGATVLLSHAPVRARQAESAGVELMLSGHTHGGQIWPLGYLVRRYYPLFAGRYELGDMTVIVSRGAGTYGVRMRLWRVGEILRITLRCE